jgi:hypothetical protein
MKTAPGCSGAAALSLERRADERLWLGHAARAFGVNRHKLRDAAAAGRVRATVVDGRRWLFERSELAEDLERLLCRYEGCDAVALGASGGCEAHGHVFLGARAAGVERPDVGAKIAEMQRGRRHTPETIAKLTKYPARRCWCEWCGKDLGIVLGHVIAAGGGRFCNDPSHPTLWRWANEPETFPQSAGAGAAEFPCWICRGRTVERWPSQVAAGGGERKARFTCELCAPLWRRDVMRARLALRRREPQLWTRTQTREAFVHALTIAGEFELAVLSKWPRKQGRRPPLAVDIVIEAAFREGLTDAAIAELLNWAIEENRLSIPGRRGTIVLDSEYVRQRRNRVRIWRRARAA